MPPLGLGEQQEKVAITEMQVFRNLEVGSHRAENQTLRRGAHQLTLVSLSEAG